MLMRVMVAILNQHGDKFIGIPCMTSKDAKEAREYVEEHTVLDGKMESLQQMGEVTQGRHQGQTTTQRL